MVDLSLSFSFPLSPHTAPHAHSIVCWVFMRVIFYLPFWQLLQSPLRARLTCQLLLLPTGSKGSGGLCYLYPEFLILQTAFSSLINVSLDEHQYCCDTGLSFPSKVLGCPGEKKRVITTKLCRVCEPGV